MKYDKKEVAKRLLQDIGGIPRVYSFSGDESKKEIDVCCVDNSPIEHVSSYSTIGLSSYTLDKKIEEKSLRTEIIGATDSRNDLFPNIISDCAFKVMEGYSCVPGTVFLNVIDNYYLNSNMKHVLLTIPFLWNLQDLEFEHEYVTWLLAVPISDSEYDFFAENGYKQLETLFEKSQIDIYDLNRVSVI